ncbi:MAG: hypothetical protein HLUCCA12_04720 [Rhodobacteraceae bacterium HLUCCA12]|nr:MAG: hypothetical protein HLUCCA12_04720 [Rhodobacteraceae bacterium HLUCCA12]
MDDTTLTCACGQVSLTLKGPPILSAECACQSCRKAAKLLHDRLGVDLQEKNDTTRYVLYRKDRVRIGSGKLAELRLSAKSGTRRVVATCCNTPMFLEITQGHWLSVYGKLWPPTTLPALEMRTMVMDHPAPARLSPDVPNPRRHTVRFMARLLTAWAAMGFRTPALGTFPPLETDARPGS